MSWRDECRNPGHGETRDRAFQAGDPCPDHPDVALVAPYYRAGRPFYMVAGETADPAFQAVECRRQTGDGLRYHRLCERPGCPCDIGHRRRFCSSWCRLKAWRLVKRAPASVSP